MTSAATTSANQTIDGLFARYGARYTLLATATVMLATFAMVLASTIINVAIPSIMGAFGIDQTQAQWLSTGFLAAMTAAMLCNAWAVATFGARKVYIAALGAFAMAAIMGGLAPNETVLIFSRVVQGAAAGVIQPLAMIIIFQVFPPHQRGRGMGIFGLGVVLGPALGPVIGGLLVDAFSWRAVFYLVLPACFAGMAMGYYFLPDRDPNVRRPSFDWIGFVLLVTALATLLWALSNGQRYGWESDLILGSLALGIATAVAFVWRQLRNPEPLLDMRVYASFGFILGSILAFTLGAALFGSTYLIPLFVQEIQGLTPTAAGVLLLPAGLVMAFMAPIAGRLSDRDGVHVPIMWGFAMIALSMFLTAQADARTGFWMLLFWIVLSRIGLALVMPSITTGSMRFLDMAMLPQGSGALNFIRQLGGAFGVNLVAVGLDRRIEFQLATLKDEVTGAGAATRDLLSGIEAILVRIGIPDGQRSGLALDFLERMIYLQGYTKGFQDSFFLLGVFFSVVLVPAWLLGRATRNL